MAAIWAAARENSPIIEGLIGAVIDLDSIDRATAADGRACIAWLVSLTAMQVLLTAGLARVSLFAAKPSVAAFEILCIPCVQTRGRLGCALILCFCARVGALPIWATLVWCASVISRKLACVLLNGMGICIPGGDDAGQTRISVAGVELRRSRGGGEDLG